MLKVSILSLAIAGIALSNTTSHFSKPVIMSNKAIYVAENKKIATTIKTDVYKDIRYRIIKGVDKDHFSLDKKSGELSFIKLPNFEKPKDFNQDNKYEVTIMIKDKKGNKDKKNLIVTVLDVVELSD